MARTLGILGPCSSAGNALPSGGGRRDSLIEAGAPGEAREARAGQGEARREVSSNPQPSPRPLPEGEGDILPLLIFVTATAVICQVSRRLHFLRLRAGVGLRFAEPR